MGDVESFEMMRERLKGKGLIQPKLIRVAKARTTINRREKRKAKEKIFARALGKEERMACLDLSMKKTGIAWGTPGGKVRGATVVHSTAKKADPEGDKLLAMSDGILAVLEEQEINRVFFSEFYSAKNMLSFRANVGLRGVLLARLAERGIEGVGVPEISARKAAGVDVSGKQPGDREGYMKLRVRARLTALGLGNLGEDDGDAAILLLGAAAYMEIDPPRLAEGGIVKYDLSLLI